jgi:hypothetical protein
MALVFAMITVLINVCVGLDIVARCANIVKAVVTIHVQPKAMFAYKRKVNIMFVLPEKKKINSKQFCERKKHHERE